MFSSLRSEEVEEAQPLEALEEEPANNQDDSKHCLWVDEFAPQHYTELLSDDVRPCSCCLAFLLPRMGNSGSSQTINNPWGC